MSAHGSMLRNAQLVYPFLPHRCETGTCKLTQGHIKASRMALDFLGYSNGYYRMPEQRNVNHKTFLKMNFSQDMNSHKLLCKSQIFKMVLALWTPLYELIYSALNRLFAITEKINYIHQPILVITSVELMAKVFH